MTELIKVTTNQQGVQVVSARDLHSYLEATERFSNWFDRQLQFGFEENQDYVGCKVFNALANQELTDYALTIDMAKEISMLQRSEKGKMARQYFIECERKLNQLTLPSYQIQDELLRAEAWILERKRHLLELETKDNAIKVLEPKAEFYDTVVEIGRTFDFSETAKMLGLGFGNITLMSKLRERKILSPENVAYQRYISSGYFELKQTVYGQGEKKKVHIQTRVTEKGIKWLNNNRDKI